MFHFIRTLKGLNTLLGKLKNGKYESKWGQSEETNKWIQFIKIGCK